MKVSRPPSKVKIEVYSDSDAVLADEEHDFTGHAAGAPLIVTWKPSSDAPVGRIEVKAYDVSGAWAGVEITPWFVSIPHEDVNFQTGSSEIQPAEAPKLEAAYTKLEEVLAKDREHGRMHPGITLYIAGHTDTVGSASSNLKLSQDRARSISAWFRKRGVKLPISYEGFGETSLAVKTADNVDEVKQPPRRLRPVGRTANLQRRLPPQLEADPLSAAHSEATNRVERSAALQRGAHRGRFGTL